jgi:hypothetical protein
MKCINCTREEYNDRTEVNKARTDEALILLKRAWGSLVGALNTSDASDTSDGMSVMYCKGGSGYGWDASNYKWEPESTRHCHGKAGKRSASVCVASSSPSPALPCK